MGRKCTPGRLAASTAACAAAFLVLVGCVRPEKDKSERAVPKPVESVPVVADPPASPDSAAAVPPSGDEPAPSAPAHVEPGKIDAVVEVNGAELLARVRASGARGTLVNAWASWCGPCKEEFPMLVALQAKLKKRGVEVLFVSVDEPETHAAARAFAEQNGLSGELLVATRPLGPFKKALNPEWPGMLPATFLFDAGARLRHFWGGPVYEDELMPVVEGFLAGKAIDGSSMPGLSPGLDLRD